jgi:hypothetical protein
LQEQLKQAREREYVAAWREDYAAVKAKRDAVAQMFRERYPAIVDELVMLMTNIASTDKAVNRINSAAPDGDHPRLRDTELTARGLDRLMQPDVSITQELRLPNFTRGAGEALLAYPLPQPNFAVEFVNSIPPDTFDWRNWHEESERRDGRLRAENARIITQAEERQRAREEREAAEAKEANQVAVER